MDIEGEAKSILWKIFGNISPNDWEFLNKILQDYIMFISIQNKLFYSILSNFDKVMQYDAQSSSEFLHCTWKTQNLHYLCNSLTNFHKI